MEGGQPIRHHLGKKWVPQSTSHGTVYPLIVKCIPFILRTASMETGIIKIVYM
jgi:hypothetical protein